MTDRPILFSAPMVRALLAGTKTQTRRIFKPRGFEFFTHPTSGDRYSEYRPYRDGTWDESRLSGGGPMRSFGWGELLYSYLPVYPGDRLWVRETWSGHHVFRDTLPAQRESFSTPDGPYLREDVWLWADGEPTGGDYEKPRPGIHMPRWASRLTLTVTDVRVERLQDISEEDAIAEGCGQYASSTKLSRPFNPDWKGIYREGYAELWNEINGAGSWEANPWVVAYSFTVQHFNIDQLAKVAA